ncbi:Sec62 family protein translocation protein [Tsukamurella sp. PLM1]|uniref:Sec62 family protein translocation protein n=1 Tax=Tsukamurella sp. PLM1 TaxID=2929795 RepID=UPI0020BDF591|nr:Sec62 family protein translocation protein [Tsukamurella sp. PLM1]
MRSAGSRWRNYSPGKARPPPAGGGRRRRHRGGENSITVAELTGEIPVVRDDVPETPAAQSPSAQAATEQPEASADPAVTEQPEDDEPITSSFLAAAVEDVRSEDDGAAAGAAEADATEVEVAEAEVVDTGDAEAVEADVAEAEVVDDADARTDVEHHTNEGHTEANYAWSKWDQSEAPIMATADFNTAQVRERQARFADADNEPTVDVAPVTDVPDEAAPSAPDTAALSAQQIDEARAALDTDAAPAVDVAGAEDGPAAPKGRGQGWLALIAEVVLGVAAGAGLFFGFFKLWNWGGGTWTIALTVVLAFVVIIAIVMFTHFLRRTTDYLTLGLALFVGLVITFGPLVMALASD